MMTSFNKEEMDILFEDSWSKYLAGNTALQSMFHNEDMDLDVTKEIARELYDQGQQSVYESVREFFAKTYHGGIWGQLVDWLHDKLGIN